MKIARESFLVNTFNKVSEILYACDNRGQKDFATMIQLHEAGSRALLRLLSGNTNNLKNSSPVPVLTSPQNIDDYSKGGPEFDSSMKYDFEPFVWTSEHDNGARGDVYTQKENPEDNLRLIEIQKLAEQRHAFLFNRSEPLTYSRSKIVSLPKISTEPLELELVS